MTTSRQDFSPAPGSAPLSRQVRAQALMETKLLLRNGEQLLLAVVIPVLALVGGVLAAKRLGIDFDENAVDVLTPGVIALAVMSTSFTSLAIATGFERRYGLLKRLGASPLPKFGLLAGKVIALLGVQVFQAVVIAVVALCFGWRPGGGFAALLIALAAALLGTAAFAGLGLAVAGSLRAEATLAVANLVYLLLMMGGGIVLPRDTYGSAGAVIQFLPSAALGDAMRDGLIDGSANLTAFFVLALWTVAAGALASRSFKWE